MTEPRKLVVFPKGLVETSDVCLLNWAESGGSQQPNQFPDLEVEVESEVVFFSLVFSRVLGLCVIRVLGYAGIRVLGY